MLASMCRLLPAASLIVPPLSANCRCTLVVQIGAGIARLYCVGKGQGASAAAAGVIHYLICCAGFESELW